MMSHSRTASILLLASLFLGFGSVSDAAADDSKWHLRLFASQVKPDLATDDIDSDSRAEAESDLGVGLSLEYRFNRRVGLEFGGLSAEPNIRVRQFELGGPVLVAEDGLGMRPIFAALNVHFTPDHKVDVYAGPLVAYVLYDNLRFAPTGGGDVELNPDDDPAYGFNLGFDVQLGQGSERGAWTIGGSLKYLVTHYEATVVGGDNNDLIRVDIDPLIASFGVGYRF